MKSGLGQAEVLRNLMILLGPPTQHPTQDYPTKMLLLYYPSRMEVFGMAHTVWQKPMAEELVNLMELPGQTITVVIPDCQEIM